MRSFSRFYSVIFSSFACFLVLLFLFLATLQLCWISCWCLLLWFNSLFSDENTSCLLKCSVPLSFAHFISGKVEINLSGHYTNTYIHSRARFFFARSNWTLFVKKKYEYSRNLWKFLFPLRYLILSASNEWTVHLSHVLDIFKSWQYYCAFVKANGKMGRDD